MYEGDAALVLVGPSDTESLDRRITEMGSGVTDLGYVERDKLERLFAACDVFAFPTRSDVFPLVILEALSHGAPVITTRVGAIPEFIDEDVGRLVDREAPNQIVSAMNTLLEDKNKRQSMAEVGRQMIRDQFSWDAVAAETFDMYKQVLTD
jgi:glycosyltransferase involved in cell wall biosynthesis